MNNIVIIDYGTGNIDSVLKAVKYCGGDAIISSKAQDIEDSTHLILPGVGVFDEAMDSLASTQLIPIIKKQVKEFGIPLLGICLGMQLLSSFGEEGRGCEGLDLIPGKVKKMNPTDGYKIPHVGWNNIILKHDSEITEDIETGQDFYFVHSYEFCCDKEDSLVAVTDYMNNGVAAIVQKNNVYGVQFHPEKSQKVGAKLLQNFINL